ncbi:MAG TPA: hypothetical protein VN063_00215 [Methylophilaceae bacterium]|nr:hypothetical protein [Methylophilaceae bacterium]
MKPSRIDSEPRDDQETYFACYYPSNTYANRPGPLIRRSALYAVWETDHFGLVMHPIGAWHWQRKSGQSLARFQLAND